MQVWASFVINLPGRLIGAGCEAGDCHIDERDKKAMRVFFFIVPFTLAREELPQVARELTSVCFNPILQNRNIQVDFML